MTATNRNWLEELKPGDDVIVAKHLHDSVIRKVVRLTPTQIIIKGFASNSERKFSKKNGAEIGGGEAVFASYLHEANEKNVKEVTDLRKRKLLSFWFNSEINRCTLADMEKMISALSTEDRARLKVPQGE